MGQTTVLIRIGLQIEEDRSRQPLRIEIRPSVAPVQVPTGVQYAKAWIAELRRQGTG